MNNSLRCQLTVVVIALLNVHSSQTASQTSTEEKDVFPEDFMMFLKSLEPRSYFETTRNPLNYGYDYKRYSNSPRQEVTKKNDNILITQKDALEDVLMMKLVSYYEDKYRISHHDTMTPRSSISDIPSLSMNKVAAINLDNGLMIPRRTVDISRASSHQNSKPGVAEVVVM